MMVRQGQHKTAGPLTSSRSPLLQFHLHALQIWPAYERLRYSARSEEKRLVASGAGRKEEMRKGQPLLVFRCTSVLTVKRCYSASYKQKIIVAYLEYVNAICSLIRQAVFPCLLCSSVRQRRGGSQSVTQSVNLTTGRRGKAKDRYMIG